MSDELVRWLSGCLDAIEGSAHAASPSPWSPNAEGDEVMAVDGEHVADGFALSNRQLRATVDHIALHDPRAVLARVEAERAVVGRHSRVRNDFGSEVCGECDVVEDGARDEGQWPCETLHLLAYGHRYDHPSYDPAWAPHV